MILLLYITHFHYNQNIDDSFFYITTDQDMKNSLKMTNFQKYPNNQLFDSIQLHLD